MKLIVCAFLVMVILEEYHCHPCLERLFKGLAKKIDFGHGLSANTFIQEGSGHKRDHRRYLGHKRPSYSTNGLDHRPWYPVENPHHGNRSPYYPQNGMPFDATYNIPYRRHGTPNFTTLYNTQNGWNQAAFGPQYRGPQYGTGWNQASFGPQYRGPQYGTGWNQASFGPQYRGPQYGTGWNQASFGPQYGTGWNQASSRPQYGGPQYGTLYPSSFGTGYQIPNSLPKGSPTKNTAPVQTPVETETPQRKQLFVTPDGIRETPAEPLDNSS